jgi:zinc transport system substrate-binding protein
MLAFVGLLASAAVLLSGCNARESADSISAEPATLHVFAGIPPVGYLIERVGGPLVDVQVLMQPGQNPHIFEPSPRQAGTLEKASLFFKIGMPFENRLVEKIEAHRGHTLVVDASQAIAKRWMTEECHDEPSQCDRGHEAGEPDPHVWLCPRNLKLMAATIADALQKAAPEHADEFRKNLAALDRELDDLDARLSQTLKPFRGQTFYVFHPAFGYFADAYGLKQKSVETEGKSPTPRQLRATIKQARSEGVRIIFLQPQFDPRSARAIAAALGGAVAPIDSLAPDVVKNLDDIAAKIQQSLHS